MGSERIDPLYFGSQERRLFGCHHGPPEGSNPRLGLVIAPPLGHEYSRAHRALRQLALRVASSGMRALRFDFGGSGDSQGDDWPQDLQPWIADLEMAQRELSLRTRVARTALLGVRLSATLALEFAAGHPGSAALVLWDPILDGEGFAASLVEQERRFEASLPGPLPAASTSADGLECLGFLWPTELLAELRARRTPRFPAAPAARVLILESALSERARALAAELERSGSRVRHEASSGSQPWNEDVDRGLVPARDLDRIVEFLREEA